MKKLTKISLIASLVMFAGTSSTFADSSFDITNPLSDLKINGELRPRYEAVDVSNTKKDADALTLRTRIGLDSKLFNIDNLRFYTEVVNVTDSGDYNSLNNGNSSYNTIADPSWTRLTQAYLDYSYEDTALRVGRQAINLDNLRFVGTVNWRQMPQTFTGITLTQKVDDLNLLASYLTKRHGIAEKFVTNTKSLVLHADYKLNDSHSLTGYGYLIGSASNTYGAFLKSKFDFNNIKLNTRIEYAVQKDATLSYDSLSKPENDSSYYRVSLDASKNGFFAGVGYEVLGHDSSNNKGFATPLATLHAQNGWADMFLGTPSEGLKDLTFKLGYKSKDFGKLMAVYHDYKADESSISNDDIGSELDVVYAKSLTKDIKLVLKMADFKKGDVSSYNDSKKYWAMLNYKF